MISNPFEVAISDIARRFIDKERLQHVFHRKSGQEEDGAIGIVPLCPLTLLIDENNAASTSCGPQQTSLLM